MQIKAYSDDLLRGMDRRLERLKERFAEILQTEDYFRSSKCGLPGVSLEPAEDGTSITVRFRGIEVALIMTLSSTPDRGFQGLVTAVLVKHPLDSSNPMLGWFTFTHQGEVEISGVGDPEDKRLSRWAYDIVLTLVEKALVHSPPGGVRLI